MACSMLTTSRALDGEKVAPMEIGAVTRSRSLGYVRRRKGENRVKFESFETYADSAFGGVTETRGDQVAAKKAKSDPNASQVKEITEKLKKQHNSRKSPLSFQLKFNYPQSVCQAHCKD